jgi:hypothetical protein
MMRENLRELAVQAVKVTAIGSATAAVCLISSALLRHGWLALTDHFLLLTVLALVIWKRMPK